MTDSFSHSIDFEREALSYLPSLMALARRLTKSPTAAEDLVQDTFVKAIRAREQFLAGTNLRAWLIKIMRNTFINRYHRTALERKLMSAPLADPVADGWISNASMRAMRDPESAALRPELELQITVAIDELPEEYRTVVILADVEEFSYKEIAEAMGTPVGTVMSRLHRARRLLKTRLLQHARDCGLVQPESSVGGGETPVDFDSYRLRGARQARRSAAEATAAGARADDCDSVSSVTSVAESSGGARRGDQPGGAS